MYDVQRATVEGLDAIPLFESERLHAASVKWIGDVIPCFLRSGCQILIMYDEQGSRMAWGNRRGDLAIYDTTTKQKIKQYPGQLRRIGVIDARGSLVATGSGDSTIFIRDVRSPRLVSRITGHA